MAESSDTKALSLPERNWGTIFAEVNAWRGGCIHHFSKVETAVTETLLVLSNAAPTGASIRLRHLIGQRFEDLVAALASEEPFGELGKSVRLELSNYREKHESFRSQLCHGVVKVTVEQNGGWVVVVRTLSLRARQPERNIIVLERGEAEARLAALKQDGQTLMAMLGQLRKVAARQEAQRGSPV